MVAAGTCHVLAGLAASALAALDDYTTAAVGFVGRQRRRARADPPPGRGGRRPGRGLGNGAQRCDRCSCPPSLVLAWRARSEAVPRGALRPRSDSATRTLRLLANGIALPLALQAIYVICLPLASREGEGAVTSLGYAYLLSSAVVAVTASSLGLVTAVPLTRTGLGGGPRRPPCRRVRLARGARHRLRGRRSRARRAAPSSRRCSARATAARPAPRSESSSPSSRPGRSPRSGSP